MRLLFAILMTLALSGCATASGSATGPHGRPIFTVEAPYASMLFKKATEVCPAGYEFVTPPMQDGGGAHHATVECKLE